MNSKFIALFSLCVVFMVVFLPIGICMFICVGIWYLTESVKIPQFYPDATEEFNNEDYKGIQERYR